MKNRKYQLLTGLTVIAPVKSCLFCKHCTDLFYDAGGIYNTICAKQKDVVKGSKGKCKCFKQ